MNSIGREKLLQIPFWSKSVADVLGDFSVSKQWSLSQAEIGERRQKYGKNTLKSAAAKSAWVSVRLTP